MLQGKKILLAITGSIAAYKSIFLLRLLVKAGAEVRVILTPAAAQFVSVLTLSTLSKNKVLTNLSDEDTWADHVMLGRWADVMIIAPLSCNTLSKMATGACDNLLLAAYLSATCPVVTAPAMDEDMWKHNFVQNNLDTIRGYGNKVIDVTSGELASGLYGEGRMAEPEDIVTYLHEEIFRGRELHGLNAMVTAGPTYEAIDPVRFVGNHSSGKMGFALAEALYMRGADVALITGPTYLQTRYKGITVVPVDSASEMYTAAHEQFPHTQITVMAAAVADYTPMEVSQQKIKKTANELILHLTKTNDILKSLGSIKKGDQILVGFALETNDEKANALNKLTSKNADLIVLNSMNDAGAGFKSDTNKVTIFDRQANEFAFRAKSKQMVANDIVELIIKKRNEKL